MPWSSATMRQGQGAGSMSRRRRMRFPVRAGGPAGWVSSAIDGAAGADAFDGEADPVGEVVLDGVHDGLSGVVVVDLADAQQQAAAGDFQGGGQLGGGLDGGELGQAAVDGDAAVAVQVGVQGLAVVGEGGGVGGGEQAGGQDIGGEPDGGVV